MSITPPAGARDVSQGSDLTVAVAPHPRFRRHQLVRHRKTDGVYRIVHTPKVCRT